MVNPHFVRMQLFNSPEEAIPEPTVQQIREGIAREMLYFNPNLQVANLPLYHPPAMPDEADIQG